MSFIPGFNAKSKVNVSFHFDSFLLLNTIFAYHLYKKTNRTMINKIIWIIGIVWIGNIQNGVQAQRRNFIHPGITYTQGDLDRMKAMVKAKHEPYYSTFSEIKGISLFFTQYASYQSGENKSEKDVFNATIGVDGRRAHDLALLWHLTGDEAYARKAVEYLNANSYYTNTSSRGTGPLDNGKRFYPF